jgi:hypothetical protein
MDLFIGFDSAWANYPKAPAAICAAIMRLDDVGEIHKPQLVSFAQTRKKFASHANPQFDWDGLMTRSEISLVR